MHPSISHDIIDQAMQDHGIDLWGGLAVESLEKERPRLKAWLDQQYHADMDWMHRNSDKRLDVQQLWPGAKSILVVAINYFPGWEAGQGEDVKIARYALGKDYHNVIRKRLRNVLKQLQETYPELKGRPFTDSAPLLEKPLATMAGLGWQGKHSLLITKEYGSWVFIGSLVLNMELESPLMPAVNQLDSGHCGTCTRCIEACPTDAIVEPTVVDSNKCIAYWTIESKALEIPKAVKDQQQNWVFGCDICQEVCPWNLKFSSVTSDVAFHPRPLLNPIPSRQALQGWDNALFDKGFENSPLKRTGLLKLKVNASY